jgi:hypothetical protein
MNTFRRSLLLGFAALALAGCATRPDVSRIADPDVDFHSYRSFALVQGTDNPSLIDRRILSAARSQLEHRGYVFDDQDPDLLVLVAAFVEDRPGERATPGIVANLGGAGTGEQRLGRMAIDLIDAHRQRVVWHGSAEGRVSPAMLRDAGSAVETAVAAVFGAVGERGSAPAAVPATKVR